jgi:hypothetical protein
LVSKSSSDFFAFGPEKSLIDFCVEGFTFYMPSILRDDELDVVAPPFASGLLSTLFGWTKHPLRQNLQRT